MFTQLKRKTETSVKYDIYLVIPYVYNVLLHARVNSILLLSILVHMIYAILVHTIYTICYTGH